MAKQRKHLNLKFLKKFAKQQQIRPVFVLALGGAFILATIMILTKSTSSVLGDVNEAVATPTNVTVSNYECKGDHSAWGTVSWNGDSRANAYRIKVWNTAGDLLGSMIVESKSRDMEMYREIDTDISVQSLVRESREGEKRVVADSDDSVKVRVRAEAMQAVCEGEFEDEEVNAEELDREHEPIGQLPTKKAITLESTQPTTPTETQEKTELKDSADVEEQTGGDAKIKELEDKITQLDTENEEQDKRQGILQSLVEKLLSVFEGIFKF